MRRTAAAVYRVFAQGEILLTDAASAEMAKLVENAYRDVNIAFANELSLISESLQVDVWEVIRLANHHPRVNILTPGPGVGGHCIAVDPWFIVGRAELTLIRTAREVNDPTPPRRPTDHCQGDRFRSPTVACLGLTFKANVDDVRESPAVEVVELWPRPCRTSISWSVTRTSAACRIYWQTVKTSASSAPTRRSSVPTSFALRRARSLQGDEPIPVGRQGLYDTRGFWR